MKKLMMFAMLLPAMSFGADRWVALSMIETGHNDRVVGRAGEISRYQILKQEWNTVTRSRRYTDPALAKTVAETLMTRRVEQFKKVHKRMPNDFEFYVLWNAPGQMLKGKVSPVVTERAQRYQNLCMALNPPNSRLYAAAESRVSSASVP